MAVFVALYAPDGSSADPALQRRLADGVAFLGAPRAAASPDGALHAAFAGRGADFVSDGAVSLVASGRLDDRARLAAALDLAAGAATCDLVAAAYARWGAAMLEHVIGDFAFVLWDARERRLLAATDQFGSRPIHHGSAGSRLILGTAIAPIRDSGLVDTDLDDAWIADFIAAGVNLDVTATVHRGIRKLPPAHRLRASAGRTTIERYWRIPAPGAPLRLPTREAYVEQFRSTFFAAVADRLPPDGPIDVAVTGGMDSTSIAAAACEILGPEAAAARMHANTIVYRGYPEEEGRFARLVTDRLGIAATQWTAEDFLLRPAPAKWRLGPQPDTLRDLLPEQAIAETAAARGASQLSGLGGDPLLWPTALKPWSPAVAGAWSPAALSLHLRLFGAAPSLGLRPLARQWLRAPRGLSVPPWLRADFVAASGLEARLARQNADRRDGMAGLGRPFWARLASVADPGNSGLDLPVSRPFMDVRLLELAARLPLPLLPGKQILREAMRPWLPAEVLARPKTPLGRAALYVAEQPEVVARQSQLLARASALAPYVELAKLREAAAGAGSGGGAMRRCEALAVWLDGTRRLA